MELFSILRRRWILASILLLLTLAATVGTLIKLPTTYQSISSVVFLAPKSAAKAYDGNPYLAFNSALNQTADVVRYETNDTRTASSLATQGYTSSYLVTDAADTSGPVLIATVTGSDKAEVERTLQAVTNQVTSELNALQTGLARENRITATVITFMVNPTAQSSKKLRPVSVVGGIGLVLTVGIPIIVDAIALRRRAGGRRPPSGQPGQRVHDGDLSWPTNGDEAPSRNAASGETRNRPSWQPTERSGRIT